MLLAATERIYELAIYFPRKLTFGAQQLSEAEADIISYHHIARMLLAAAATLFFRYIIYASDE